MDKDSLQSTHIIRRDVVLDELGELAFVRLVIFLELLHVVRDVTSKDVLPVDLCAEL